MKYSRRRVAMPDCPLPELYYSHGKHKRLHSWCGDGALQIPICIICIMYDMYYFSWPQISPATKPQPTLLNQLTRTAIRRLLYRSIMTTQFPILTYPTIMFSNDYKK